MSNGVRWTEEQLADHEKRLATKRAALKAEAVRERKQPKYGNTPTNGHASKREAKRAAELRLLEKAGQIRNLREQVKFVLIPKQDGERVCKYVADFVYEEMVNVGNQCGWSKVVEDCKGFRTPIFRIKKKLMLHVHGIRVRET